MLAYVILSLCVYSGVPYKVPCPRTCQGGVSPVCGSDGVIYNSECQIRKHNCGYNDSVTESSWSTCKLSSGLSSCSDQCSEYPDLVCGSDGRTYLNQCYLMVETCMRGVSLAHYGGCYNNTQECPTTCTGAGDGPVCGSDGVVYSSMCDMRLATCGQGVVATGRSHCLTTQHCGARCRKVRRVVCGSDGQLYANR